jgi:hypothetical protein
MQMKTIVTIAAGVLLSYFASGQETRAKIESTFLPKLSPHYVEEYSFDRSTNEQAWNSVPKGLNASFASADQLYFRRDVPEIESSTNKEVIAWKGERVNFQLMTWSADTLGQVRVRMLHLSSKNGKKIGNEAASFYMVRYVISNYPYGARNAVCGESPYKDGFLMPDRFEKFDRYEIPGKTARPVWMTIDIPADAVAGNYEGIVEVSSASSTKQLPFKIKVQNMTLPPPSEWKHLLDLWQNPWAVAWSNNLEPWSDQHKSLLKQHLKLYADAGGKYITTYAVHSPWADNSFMIEGGMIEWIKTKNGSWKFDYSIFDDYVQLAMDCGINKAITIYTPVPWGERFRFKDEATGNYVTEQWKPETEVFRKHWNVFLTDLQKHLQAKGWFNITYLGINENAMNQTLAAIKVIREHSPAWRITYAGDWHNELDTLLNDYSYLYGKEPTSQQQKQRSARGATTTYYVCCNPPYPNNFVFSPPVEGRWLSWYTAAAGYDGFLRWAYDAWPEDPQRDARHGSWAAGDCFLVYPGGNSCIRFEKLRQGIVDFEKIRILKERAAKSGNTSAQSLLTQLNDHLKVFTAEKNFDTKKIQADVDKGQALVAQLTEALASVK